MFDSSVRFSISSSHSGYESAFATQSLIIKLSTQSSVGVFSVFGSSTIHLTFEEGTVPHTRTEREWKSRWIYLFWLIHLTGHLRDRQQIPSHRGQFPSNNKRVRHNSIGWTVGQQQQQTIQYTQQQRRKRFPFYFSTLRKSPHLDHPEEAGWWRFLELDHLQHQPAAGSNSLSHKVASHRDGGGGVTRFDCGPWKRNETFPKKPRHGWEETWARK